MAKSSDPLQRNEMPPEPLSVLWPALQVGGLTGMSGMLFGSVAGVLKSTTPTLFALASGIQWFMLGSTYWATRSIVLHAWGEDYNKPRDKISASSIAGGIAGCAGGLLRGRRNIVPGAIMFAVFGAAGQTVYNMADARHGTHPLSASNSGKAWLDSKWSPVKVLSDDEYERMLQEKLLRVEAEIALVDENIMGLRDSSGRSGELGEARVGRR